MFQAYFDNGIVVWVGVFCQRNLVCFNSVNKCRLGCLWQHKYRTFGAIFDSMKVKMHDEVPVFLVRVWHSIMWGSTMTTTYLKGWCLQEKKKNKNRGGHITKTITNNYLHYSPNPFDYNTLIHPYMYNIVLL